MSTYTQLLAQYGSPIYAYDLAQIRAAHRALRAALPDEADLYYSLKANPHPRIASELCRLQCRAEISSPGELESALAAGFTPDQCLYTGPAKTQAELHNAFQRGVCFFSVESAWDVQKVSACAEAAKQPAAVLLRVNADQAVPGLGLAMTGVASQFGIDASTIAQHPQDFRGTRWAQVIGFHFYMGTNISDPHTLLAMIEVSLDQAQLLAQVLDIQPQVIDLGGGFGHPFAKQHARPDFAAVRPALEALLDQRAPGWRQRAPMIVFESGRYLIAGAGTLVCTVQDVKVSKENIFVVLDSGIHHLGGMSGLGRMFRIEPQAFVPDIPADPHAAMPHGAEKQGAVSSRPLCLVGPLCTPLDIWSRAAELPNLQPGDIIAIPNVGAYGLTASLITFLSHACPVEIVLDGTCVQEASQLVVHRITR